MNEQRRKIIEMCKFLQERSDVVTGKRLIEAYKTVILDLAATELLKGESQ